MERKNQDCYFYYYSTCTKGDQCVFRHEPSALGCETVCPFWLQRKCDNWFCSLRHMELKKNRKSIPCYWETQPGGCRKPHCPFMHKNPRDTHQMVETDKKECEQHMSSSQPPLDRGDWSRGGFEHSQGHIQVASDGDANRMGPRRISQGSITPGPVPDPLVVSFDDGFTIDLNVGSKAWGSNRVVVPCDKTFKSIKKQNSKGLIPPLDTIYIELRNVKG